jgi:hypothetical protein
MANEIPGRLPAIPNGKTLKRQLDSVRPKKNRGGTTMGPKFGPPPSWTKPVSKCRCAELKEALRRLYDAASCAEIVDDDNDIIDKELNDELKVALAEAKEELER